MTNTQNLLSTDLMQITVTGILQVLWFVFRLIVFDSN